MAVDYLSSVEQSVLDEFNLARTNPSAYADILAQRRQYYNGNLLQIPGQITIRTNEGVAAVDEAIRVLRSTSPLPALSPSQGMSLGARDHVNDIGPKGLETHIGTDGSTPTLRVNRYGQGFAGENIDFGANTGREIAIDLLVDDGESSRGHRENILKPSFRFAGISVGSHAQYGTMAVITFADAYKEASAPPTTPVPNPTPPPIPIAPPSDTGSDGNHTLLGTAGSDTLQGGSGIYTLYGGNGNDLLVGGIGNDLLNGGKGDDYLIGGGGIDTVVGGLGSDTFAFASNRLAIIPDFDVASDFIELLGDLKGSRVLVARNDSNSFGVYASINGSNKALALLTNFTGDANSISRKIIGGQQTPIVGIVGTAGNDTLSGQALGDTISGLAGSDDLRGGDGNDSLDGGDGNDALRGQVGNDTLLGGAGNEFLDGGDGDDFLNGGNGDDFIVGGAGKDTFFFGASSGQDQISDFFVADDKIQVAASLGFSNGAAVLAAITRKGSVPRTQFSFSEITLSPENKFVMVHDVPLTAANFIIV